MADSVAYVVAEPSSPDVTGEAVVASHGGDGGMEEVEQEAQRVHTEAEGE